MVNTLISILERYIIIIILLSKNFNSLSTQLATSLSSPTQTLGLEQFDIIAEAIVNGSANTVAHALTKCLTMSSTLTALAINSETN
jgi:hypothetical protein